MVILDNNSFIILLLMPAIVMFVMFPFGVWSERIRLKKKGIVLDKFWSFNK